MTPPDRKIVEAILLVAEDPVPASILGQVLERPTAAIEALLAELAEEYEASDRGFRLLHSEPGWRLYSDPDCAPWLERFVRGDKRGRLSPAALEVLAVIAYRGPISRAQIGEIRGVDSDRVVKTLETRGLIEPADGTEAPGGAVLFSVSPLFMERLGLGSLDELPPVADFMPDAEAVEDMEARLSPGA